MRIGTIGLPEGASLAPMAGVTDATMRLLESTDLNISAVAEQTGFASAAHFRRVFRETMGTGPLQYRKSHRG